ncbi:alpha/beta hydrolase [Oceanobacillus arenosus]|uniref:Alpha/beta hydrolase n=1 Tax=Oceanobacillus arenosus TaxID=1229153 RepID=A0A3D8PSH7_9BACI|nr:alpha/beta hydrolase [Oceanobacillus arenosus]RDW18119.1 alpha/beta hydrolase [Oceanobacillus arenosus]
MRGKIIIVASALVILLLAALFLAVNYFYGESVKRGVEVELYGGDEITQDVSIEDQVILEEAKQWFNNQDLQIIELTSNDHLTLQANFIENDSPTGKAVILAHGYREQSENMGDYAKFYYDQGFDILLPDARGHGESKGEYIGYGWHDRLDYLKWIELLIKEYEAEQIILHGKSMGASLVLMASGEKLPAEVKGIVADSGYTSVKEELSYQLKHLYNLPSFPLLDFTSLMTKIRAGYTFEEASAIEQVKHNKRPLLIIHGEDDELVPTEMAQQLFAEAGGNKELWIVPNAAHTKGYTLATSEYQERLTKFLNDALNE